MTGRERIKQNQIKGLTGDLLNKVETSEYNSKVNQDVRDTASPVFHGIDIQGSSSNEMINSWMGINFYTVTKPVAPTLSLVLDASGLLGVGAYRYYITYITAVGETNHGTVASITTDASHKKVTITVPVSTDSRVTGRKIYRTPVGQADSFQLLVATINDNTTSTYEDNIADASLSAGTSRWWSPNTTSNFITVGNNRSIMLDQMATTLGFNAGLNITGAGDATFIGSQAGQSMTTGSYNTLLGSNAGYSLTTYNWNTLLGRYAGYNTNQGYNTGIGGNVLYNNTGGFYHTAIGYQAGYSNTTGYGSVFLGNQAGYYETDSQVLMIDNTTRASKADAKVKALIYGKFNTDTASQFLNVNGTFQANSYKSSDGSAGLTTTVALAKITSGGTDGSLTFKDGLLTAKVDPT